MCLNHSVFLQKLNEYSSNEVIAKIPTGDGPRHLSFSEDGKRAWSANLDHDSVSLIDVQNDKILWTSKVTSKPNYAEPAFGYVFAANMGEAACRSSMLAPVHT